MDRDYKDSEIEGVSQSRTSRNKELYKKISQNDLDDVKIHSNASVLNVEGTEIDIDRLRQILDKKYRETPRKGIDIRTDDLEPETKPESTKEYDLSSFIEKAKENKETNYEEERLKKIRDTQFNILQSINVSEYDDDSLNKTPQNQEAEDELMTLIETITHKDSEEAAFDLLEDLKGNDDTEVIPPINEDIIEDEDTFYTGNLKVKDDDYDEFNELKKEIGSNSIVIKVLLVIFFIIVIFGIIFFLDKTFAWGIF